MTSTTNLPAPLSDADYHKLTNWLTVLQSLAYHRAKTVLEEKNEAKSHQQGHLIAVQTLRSVFVHVNGPPIVVQADEKFDEKRVKQVCEQYAIDRTALRVEFNFQVQGSSTGDDFPVRVCMARDLEFVAAMSLRRVSHLYSETLLTFCKAVWGTQYALWRLEILAPSSDLSQAEFCQSACTWIFARVLGGYSAQKAWNELRHRSEPLCIGLVTAVETAIKAGWTEAMHESVVLLE